jgi:Ankyrin repeats (3 copies)/Ankyrin repeat
VFSRRGCFILSVMKKRITNYKLARCCLFAVLILAICAWGQQPSANVAVDTALHRAARTGNLALLKMRLKQGANPDLRDKDGRTPLMDAVAAGQLGSVRTLLAAGANVNAHASDGRTPLIEAAVKGRPKSARLLIAAHADLNYEQRGWGTALEAAERTGHSDIAAILRNAGARSSGHSPGDKVCVRPWSGDGYCGTVTTVNRTKYKIHVTEIVGCANGCPAKAECSAGRPVGSHDGIAVGDDVATVSWCLTQTGVKP